MGIFLDNFENSIHHPKSVQSIKVDIAFGNQFISWNPISTFFFTELELQTFHQRFDQHIADKPLNPLRRSEITGLGGTKRIMLTNISRSFEKFSLLEENYSNHIDFLDILYIDNKPILHVFDE